MLVEYLDGGKYDWKIKGKEITRDSRGRSSYHIEARRLLKLRFPTLQILEEVPFKTFKSKTLFFDFFIPTIRIAVEVHGEQHFAHSSFYHESRADFLKQAKNDHEKEEWCDINDIEYIMLPYNRIKDWEKML